MTLAEMTLEDFGSRIGEIVDEVIDGRFKIVSDSFKDINERLGRIEERFDKIDIELENHDKRITSLEEDRDFVYQLARFAIRSFERTDSEIDEIKSLIHKKGG